MTASFSQITLTQTRLNSLDHLCVSVVISFPSIALYPNKYAFNQLVSIQKATTTAISTTTVVETHPVSNYVLPCTLSVRITITARRNPKHTDLNQFKKAYIS